MMRSTVFVVACAGAGAIACSFARHAPAGEPEAGGPRKLHKGEAILQIPKAIQKDLNERAASFVRKVYPDLKESWIRKKCSAYFMRDRYVVRSLHSIEGPDVGFAGRPGIGVSFPDGHQVGVGTEDVPPGVTLEERKRPLTLEEARRVASSVLSRLVPLAEQRRVQMKLRRSGYAALSRAYYFDWTGYPAGRPRNAGRHIRVSVQKADGLVTGARLKEALPDPRVPADVIAKKARNAIKGFRRERLCLERRYDACRKRLIWKYEVPPPPGGGPEDRTLWDANTGTLLYSELLRGGTAKDPYRHEAFRTAWNKEQAKEELERQVRRRALELSEGTQE